MKCLANVRRCRRMRDECGRVRVSDDKRLEGLYDYTKFHIGIYLSAAAGLTTLIATASKQSEGAFIRSLMGWHWALTFSLALMILAGVAGAIVATGAIESVTYAQFLTRWQGLATPINQLQ